MLEEGAVICATGRRKTSVARVRVSRGPGQITVNDRELDAYFTTETLRAAVLSPLKLTKTHGKFDVAARVTGGGPAGQAGAVLLGVSRALKQMNEEFAGLLREGGLLTRDSRGKERKKYGRRAARRGFQFSKR